MSQTWHRALSAFSQTATNFLDGLTVTDVIPSDPSIPRELVSLYKDTWNVDLCLLIHVVDYDVMASWVKDPLIVNVVEVVLHISFDSEDEP
jgi:hypothetical protein